MEKKLPPYFYCSHEKSRCTLFTDYVALLSVTTAVLQAQTTDPTTTCDFLTKIGGATSTKGSEIAAFDPASQRVFTVAGPRIEFFNMSNTGALTFADTLVPGFAPPAGAVAIPNSVAVKNGILAAGFAIVTISNNAQQPGRVTFYNASTGVV
jgi:hypothetical protein